MRSCRECGCTDERACAGGCWWSPDHPDGGALCSACAAKLGLPIGDQPGRALVLHMTHGQARVLSRAMRFVATEQPAGLSDGFSDEDCNVLADLAEGLDILST